MGSLAGNIFISFLCALCSLFLYLFYISFSSQNMHSPEKKDCKSLSYNWFLNIDWGDYEMSMFPCHAYMRQLYSTLLCKSCLSVISICELCECVLSTRYCWQLCVIMTSHHSITSRRHHNHTKICKLFNQATGVINQATRVIKISNC